MDTVERITHVLKDYPAAAPPTMLMSSLDYKICSYRENFEETEDEEQTTRIEALLNEALTWLGGTPPAVGRKDLGRHTLSHLSIIAELLLRIDELLDEIQIHGIYKGYLDRPIGRNTHPHALRRAFSFEVSSLSETLWALEEEVEGSPSADTSDSEYEEGDGCLLQLGVPLPPLPSKWSRVAMVVEPLVVCKNKTHM